MAQLNSLLVTGDGRFLNTINGDITGTSSNVTGTVAIANGGTGATTRLGAAQNLTNEAVASPGYVVGLTQNWGKFGYTTIAQLKTTLGVPSAANDGKLSIKLAGTEKASFTANQSGNSIANFTFTAGTTPSTVTKKTVVTSATFNTVVTGGTTTDVPNISKKTVVTSVTPATVVTGGTTTDVPNISKKTVVTGVTKKTVVTDATFNTVVSSATVADRKLTISTGVSGSKTTGDSCTVTTGDSVTVGTAIKAYTSLTTGDSCTVSTGDSVTVGTAIKAYTTLNTGASGSAQTGDSVTVTAGTAPSLSIASS